MAISHQSKESKNHPNIIRRPNPENRWCWDNLNWKARDFKPGPLFLVMPWTNLGHIHPGKKNNLGRRNPLHLDMYIYIYMCIHTHMHIRSRWLHLAYDHLKMLEPSIQTTPEALHAVRVFEPCIVALKHAKWPTHLKGEKKNHVESAFYCSSGVCCLWFTICLIWATLAQKYLSNGAMCPNMESSKTYWCLVENGGMIQINNHPILPFFAKHQ